MVQRTSDRKMAGRGIEVRGDSIRVHFSYHGVRCRETLPVPPTKQNVEYAKNLRSEILARIKDGRFQYKDYFPDSPKCALFGGVVATAKTLSAELDDWLSAHKRTLAYSTHKEYEKAINKHIKPGLGHIPARDVSAAVVKAWVGSLPCGNKTINNILIPLRQCMADLYADGRIERNPMDRVKNLKVVTDDPDPFTRDEMLAILGKSIGQCLNLFQFAFWTGLRTSELIALEWPDVDLKSGYVRVRQARVRRKVKTTKTAAGMRDVKLLPPALEAIKRQKSFTQLKGQEVFQNPRTGKPWVSDKALREVDWKAALKLAGVRYRYPYQTRHTYASMMLSAGENPMWVAKQMGHTNMAVLLKRYARWLPDGDADAGSKMAQIWPMSESE